MRKLILFLLIPTVAVRAFLLGGLRSTAVTVRRDESPRVSAAVSRERKTAMPVTYFEIPVRDLDRAIRFYETVFGCRFERTSIDGNEMALFPDAGSVPGISGALAKGETYVPSERGTLVYFDTDDIDGVLERANKHGGKTLYPKTSIGKLGFVADIGDTEGNRVGLHSPAK